MSQAAHSVSAECKYTYMLGNAFLLPKRERSRSCGGDEVCQKQEEGHSRRHIKSHLPSAALAPRGVRDTSTAAGKSTDGSLIQDICWHSSMECCNCYFSDTQHCQNAALRLIETTSPVSEPKAISSFILPCNLYCWNARTTAPWFSFHAHASITSIRLLNNKPDYYRESVHLARCC